MGCGQSKAATDAVMISKDGPQTSTHSSTHSKTKASAQEKRSNYAMKPGYSSGASSCDDSSVEGGAPLGTTGGMGNRKTSHHDILALTTLKQEMVADGDLTKNVVRIEPSYGQPIEEVYDGVIDGKVLGSGVSGVVRLITHKATQVQYAVKVLEVGLIEDAQKLMGLRNEIFIMCQLDHPNIVRIEEVYESTNEIYIVQELCVGGDLFDRLDEQPDYHYTEAQCARLVKQMLSSVRYLHSKGIVHRDLKLENFLFSSRDPNQGVLKMIDFGLSKHFIAGQHHDEKVGTPYTVAPEILEGHYDEKCDIWAVGVITYLLLSGESPFGGLDGEHPLVVKKNIQRAQLSFKPPELWESVSKDAVAFVQRVLKGDPKMRPTAREAQRDTWIQVWSKKDASAGKIINPKTISALMSFKEQSDMQKLLSEVLSFTLLPEQIVELHDAFQKMDTEGSGEISLKAMKKVLLQNAAAGELGGLTEPEIESLFETIQVRKTDPTIRWHEFLAAGLSQAKIDDRNLRLAFDRLDANRDGYVTLHDLRDMLGNSAGAENLEKLWLDSLVEVQSDLDRISYDDFKMIMKGQPKSVRIVHPSKASMPPRLGVVTEGEEGLSTSFASRFDDRQNYDKKKSKSYAGGDSTKMWEEPTEDSTTVARPFQLQGGEKEKLSNVPPALVNRALYRRHREMRLAVLEASKQFDQKRTTRDNETQAGLIMKRGAKPPVAVEDQYTRKMFDAAARRSGRTRTEKERLSKTCSDVTGMLFTQPQQ